MAATIAMMAANRFESGANYSVVHVDEYTFKPMASRFLLGDVKAHPEHYAIVKSLLRIFSRTSFRRNFPLPRVAQP